MSWMPSDDPCSAIPNPAAERKQMFKLNRAHIATMQQEAGPLPGAHAMQRGDSTL